MSSFVDRLRPSSVATAYSPPCYHSQVSGDLVKLLDNDSHSKRRHMHEVSHVRARVHTLMLRTRSRVERSLCCREQPTAIAQQGGGEISEYGDQTIPHNINPASRRCPPNRLQFCHYTAQDFPWPLRTSCTLATHPATPSVDGGGAEMARPSGGLFGYQSFIPYFCIISWTNSLSGNRVSDKLSS